MHHATAAIALLCGLAFAAAAAAMPMTPISLRDGALRVRFEGAPHAGAFMISNDIPFERLQGYVLIELFDAFNDLTITFSQPVTQAHFDFALAFPAPSTIAFETKLGGARVSSGFGNARVPAAYFNAEGTLAVASSAFDTLVLHAPDASAFAIDNLWVTAGYGRHLFTFDTPEPLTLLLFSAGFLALRRRRDA